MKLADDAIDFLFSARAKSRLDFRPQLRLLHFIPTSRSKETHLGAIASIGLILQSVSASLDVVHTPCFMVSGKQLSYTSYVSGEKGTRQETKYSTSLHQGAPRIDTS